MSPEFYKIIHVIGLITLFTGIGGFLTYGAANAPRAKMVGILHGVGLLLLLVSGFGMTGKMGIGFPAWIIVKLVIFLILGALLAVAKRGRVSPRGAIVTALALGFVAAYLGLTWKYGFSIPKVAPAAETAPAQG
ncbi:MAG: hypothetical protein JNK37_14880 [Verrucomicrobiales bacterium]|nr:hypothetical protein [Verrucomicrobiales bacterium]